MIDTKLGIDICGNTTHEYHIVDTDHNKIELKLGHKHIKTPYGVASDMTYLLATEALEDCKAIRDAVPDNLDNYFYGMETFLKEGYTPDYEDVDNCLKAAQTLAKIVQ